MTDSSVVLFLLDIFTFKVLALFSLLDIQLNGVRTLHLLAGFICALCHVQGDRGAPGPIGPPVSQFNSACAR